MSDPLAVIESYGLTTAVGGNTRQSCAALRAGLARFESTDLHLCFPLDGNAEDLEPPMVSRVASLDPYLGGTERLVTLALPALMEAIGTSDLSRPDLDTYGLHLALPASCRPGPEDLLSFPDRLIQRAGLAKPDALTVSRAGHSGFVEAVAEAVRYLRSGRSSVSLVIAVDSLVDRQTLIWLDDADRLKCSRVPDGVMPGEAASVLVLRSRTADHGVGTVESLGLAEEPNPLLEDRPGVGVGLCQAMREAVSALSTPPDPAWAVLDQTGERYRAQEWAYTMTRLHAILGPMRHDWYLADCIGDVGAATGGVATARVLAAHDRGYAPGDRAWILLSSETEGRGALVVGGPQCVKAGKGAA